MAYRLALSLWHRPTTRLWSCRQRAPSNASGRSPPGGNSSDFAGAAAIPSFLSVEISMIKSISVPIEPVSEDNFRSFGHIIAAPKKDPQFVGPGYSTWRYPLVLGGTADLTMLRHPFGPVVCNRFEKHPTITELRVPLDPVVSVVFVASTPDIPRPQDMKGFLVDGETAMLIERNIWHSASFPLDPRGAHFLLISDRETEGELEEAGIDGVPSVYTQMVDWTGQYELVPDYSGLGESYDRLA
ncbi:MAG: hypothetical protein E5W15_00885 [Mesorhizobium sp.]|nr:MAG: hypothetical protein EOQ46_17710 [Mesorhizobium sp.]RWB64891.1 MAG: hypothetical protein EOQ48_04805 [Mesorhizobium sp.]RWB88149.1 MAG: hypothetical protein EOQ51_08785 [Mesorhizobium sp.]RWC16712.1 MAG: hypothetical protein EOS52_04925 [Mesorhizobium sp.]RWD77315.1 MAG: hypothetical protein EOS60_00415 [Mesorhizobium sp.]